jgi:hypothetical protein
MPEPTGFVTVVPHPETTPTQAQKEAGNYAKGHRSVQGLEVAIETPKGATRSGTDKHGTPWSVVMNHDYGYLKRTEGADGDAVDVFLGPFADTSDRVFVINQIDQETGDFDEHKVMLGFRTPDEAKWAYLSNYSKGWRCGPIKEMALDEFKTWLQEGDLTDVAKALPDAPPLSTWRQRGTGRIATVIRRRSDGRAMLLFHDRGVTKPADLRGFDPITKG